MKKTLLTLALVAASIGFISESKAALTVNVNLLSNTSGTYNYEAVIAGGTLTSGYSFALGSGSGWLSASNTGAGSTFNNFSVNPDGTSFSFNNVGNLSAGTYYFTGISSVITEGATAWQATKAFNPASYSGAVNGPVAVTAPVPEPGQVAASMLLIGGIVGFVIVRRRKAALVA
jgi:hypothetical protein